MGWPNYPKNLQFWRGFTCLYSIYHIPPMYSEFEDGLWHYADYHVRNLQDLWRPVPWSKKISWLSWETTGFSPLDKETGSTCCSWWRCNLFASGIAEHLVNIWNLDRESTSNNIHNNFFDPLPWILRSYRIMRVPALVPLFSVGWSSLDPSTNVFFHFFFQRWG